MATPLWLQRFRSGLTGDLTALSRGRTPPSRRYAFRRPLLESLEDRTMPSTLLVTSNRDDGSAGSLRADIIQANADAAAGISDTINFNPSLAGATIVLTQGQLELKGAGGTITIDASNLSTPVGISGNNTSRVFTVDALTTAVMSGLIIENGSGYSPTNQFQGGGVYNEGNLQLSKCTITNNSEGYGGENGGGICNDALGVLTLANCTVSDNFALNGDGGGIYNMGTVTLTSSTVSANFAQGTVGFQFGGGGGIFSAGPLTVSSSLIVANHSHLDGGGIDNGEVATITKCYIDTNSGNNNGGGIFSLPGSQLTISDSALGFNQAGNDGGGIYCSDDVTGVLTNATIAGNNCNVYTTGGQGGGIWMGTSYDLLTLNNTIVAQNANGFDVLPYTPDDIANNVNSASAYNLIGTGGAGALQDRSVDPAHGNQVGVVSPGVNLSSGANLPPVFAPLPGSPAVEAGSIALVALDGSGNQLPDVNGSPRTHDGTVDIGAVEVQKVTSASLQQLLSSRPQTSVQADTNLDAQNVVTAVNGLSAQQDVQVTLNLGSGIYTDIPAHPPAGVTLVINGNGTPTTIVGHSPALTVSSGNVIVSNLTLTTATDDPTILVTGGSLTLRNDIVQGASGYSKAAISVTGGTVDLGTAQDPGGDTLNVNGSGPFIDNETGNSIPHVGNTFEVNGTIVTMPRAFDDNYNADMNYSLNVPAMGVLSNDVDPNGSPLTAVLVSGPSHGTLSLNGDGSFSYTPAPNFHRIDSFTYQARTISGTLSNVATVTIVGGVLDPTLGSGGIVQTPALPGSPDDEADRVFVLPTGRLMVVGITQQPADFAVSISRYQSNGTLDTTFGSGTGTVITGLTSPNYISPLQLGTNVAFEADGSIVIGWGTSDAIGNGLFNELTRYRSDGSLDTGFGNNGIVSINTFPPKSSGGPAWAFAVQPDGKILITGSFQPTSGVAAVYTVLERLNTDGSLDSSFGAGGTVIQDLGLNEEVTIGFDFYNHFSQADAIAVQPDGSILVAGNTLDAYGGTTNGFLARFHPDGSLDTSFGASGEIVLVDAFALPIDFTAIGPAAVPFTPVGKTNYFSDIRGITLQADGSILVDVKTPGDSFLRLNSNGTLDSSFAQDAFSQNASSAGQFFVDRGDGLLVPQFPQDAAGNTQFALTRYNPDGTLDLSFGANGTGTAVIPIAPGADSYVQGGFALESDGKIVAVGTTSTDNKQTYHFVLARLQGEALNVTTQAAVTSQVNQVVNTAILSGQPDQVTFQASTQADVSTMLAAINALAPASSAAPTVTVTLDLGGGSYSTAGVTVNPPAANVNFVIQNGTLDPSYPALTVDSGQVTVLNCTLLTTGDAPTILVTGGSLTLRNDVIQESTGFTDAAISVTGGAVDLGTALSPGNNTLNINGTGAFVHNTTSNPIAAAGDTFTLNGLPLTPSSLSGFVFEDFNDDGQLDFGEKGISGVKITLIGTDDLGNAVKLSQLTDSDGAYVFLNLRPGNYTITETQPAGYLQGIDSVGTAGGSLSATDQFLIQLGLGVNGLNYNYGEQPPAGGSVKPGQTAGIGFWNNKNGQALIKSLNGGTGHQLGDWLAATLPNMFGSQAGSSNLAGQSNAAAAALFQSDFLLKGVKLDAQVLATALSVYATNATLDPTKVAASYGFTVSGDGAGTATVNVGTNGDAFGVANNITMTVMDLLLATDAQAVNGVLYNGNATRRNKANTVYSAVNQAGNIS